MSLAVRTQSPDPCQQNQRDLRESAIWYPTIPPRQLYLNEESFRSSDWYKVGYKPLFWCHFGGPGGKYLPHLTGLTVVSWIGIKRIRFSFAVGEEDVPLAHRSFGRLKGEEECESTVECPIDGPGGERIESITTNHTFLKGPDGEFDEQGFLIECNVRPTHIPLSSTSQGPANLHTGFLYLPVPRFRFIRIADARVASTGAKLEVQLSRTVRRQNLLSAPQA